MKKIALFFVLALLVNVSISFAQSTAKETKNSTKIEAVSESGDAIGTSTSPVVSEKVVISEENRTDAAKKSCHGMTKAECAKKCSHAQAQAAEGHHCQPGCTKACCASGNKKVAEKKESAN